MHQTDIRVPVCRASYVRCANQLSKRRVPPGAASGKHSAPDSAMGLVRWQEADLIVSILLIVDSIDSHIYAIRWSRQSSRN